MVLQQAFVRSGCMYFLEVMMMDLQATVKGALSDNSVIGRGRPLEGYRHPLKGPAAGSRNVAEIGLFKLNRTQIKEILDESRDRARAIA